MRQTRLVLFGIGTILFIAAVVWFRGHRANAAQAGGGPAGSASAERAVPVVLATVERKDAPIFIDGIGGVAAYYTVTVKPLVDGRLESMAFKEGQDVKKGDVIAQIDVRPFQIQLHTAEAAIARDQATLKNAQITLARNKALLGAQLDTQQQVDDQQAVVDQTIAAVQSDQAQAESARLNLTYSRVTAPIDGRTGVRLVDPGNVVHAADLTGLVVITQLDPIAVLFSLPEDDLPRVQKAMAKGTLDVEAFSRDGKISLGTGKVELIDNQINQTTGTIRIKAIFDNKAGTLWPNQFVKARLHLATKKDATMVPAAVVQRGPTGSFAYVVDDKQIVSMRTVDVELIQGDTAFIAKGLTAGETVVADGQFQLRPGSKIASRPAAASSAPPVPVGEAPPKSSANAP